MPGGKANRLADGQPMSIRTLDSGTSRTTQRAMSNVLLKCPRPKPS